MKNDAVELDGLQAQNLAEAQSCDRWIEPPLG
jgi:hypothetical protein